MDAAAGMIPSPAKRAAVVDAVPAAAAVVRFGDVLKVRRSEGRRINTDFYPAIPVADLFLFVFHSVHLSIRRYHVSTSLPAEKVAAQ